MHVKTSSKKLVTQRATETISKVASIFKKSRADAKQQYGGITSRKSELESKSNVSQTSIKAIHKERLITQRKHSVNSSLLIHERPSKRYPLVQSTDLSDNPGLKAKQSGASNQIKMNETYVPRVANLKKHSSKVQSSQLDKEQLQ